jgi:hypothetical protein
VSERDRAKAEEDHKRECTRSKFAIVECVFTSVGAPYAGQKVTKGRMLQFLEERNIAANKASSKATLGELVATWGRSNVPALRAPSASPGAASVAATGT